MFCSNCGTNLPDESRFCPNCGKSVSSNTPPVSAPQQPSPQIQPPPTPVAETPAPKKGSSPLLLGAIIGVVAVLGIAAGAFFFLNGGAETPDPESSRPESSDTQMMENPKEISPDSQTPETDAEDPKAEPQEEASVDAETLEFRQMLHALNTSGESHEKIAVFANNRLPGVRNTNYAWNSGLFYTLEEISPDVYTDGQINGYNIEKKQLINADTNNLMEYEIYRHPDTGIVNKIVSIEYKDDMLEITDYYYTDDHQPNFIFIRNDSNYVPSYATPDKTGQRYYFHNDTLVKWRVVDNGQRNYLIGKAEKDRGGNAGTVTLYADLDAATQTKFDEKEVQMLNAAYNTYDVVLNAEGIGHIVGFVYDEQGNPLPNTEIQLYSEDH